MHAEVLFQSQGQWRSHRERPTVQFPCIATAKADAVVIIRGLLADLPGEWQCGTIGFAFEICNEAGELLDIVKFEDAVLLH